MTIKINTCIAIKGCISSSLFTILILLLTYWNLSLRENFSVDSETSGILAQIIASFFASAAGQRISELHHMISCN